MLSYNKKSSNELLNVAAAWLVIFTALPCARAEDPFVSQGFIQLPANPGSISAVQVDKDDKVYVLQRGNPPILVYDDPRKEHVRGIGDGLFKQPHGFRLDRDGALWTTDGRNHVVRKFSREGKLLLTLGEVDVPGGDPEHFRAPDDIVFSSTGDIYIADSGNFRIVKLSRDGTFQTAWGKQGKGPGEFHTPHGLSIDRNDRIYVADRGNNRVQVFEGSGKFVAEWSGFGNPYGVFVSGTQLLVSDGDAHKIIHLDLKSGAVVASWGGPDMLKLPQFMATDSRGTLYVAEVTGKRIQMFRKK